MLNKGKDLIILAAIAAIGVGAGWFYKSYKEKSFEPVIYKSLGGNFTLDSANGPFELFKSNGKVRILYFGFTACPDVCPLSMNKLLKAIKFLSPGQRKQILPIFISVDYKRDTPQSVQEYTEFFASDFLGLTGTKESIDKVTKQYGAFYEFVEQKDSAMEYTVDHSSRFYLIDKEGKYRESYSNIADNKNFKDTLVKLIGEKYEN